MTPMPVINRGFGGSHIEYVKWFDQIVAPYHPRAIVFYAGEKDLDAGKSVARVVADFDEFMTRKVHGLGKTPAIWSLSSPRSCVLRQFSLQRQVNADVRTRAKRSDLHYIDVVPAMLDNAKPRDIFQPDNLHMTAAGYAIWTRAVRIALLPDMEAEGRRLPSRSRTERSESRRPKITGGNELTH